jgi:hypothetical protein
MTFTRLSRIALFLILALTVSAAAFAAPVASVRTGGAQVDWQVAISGYDHIQMNVMTPDGEVFTRNFKAGETPSFQLKDSRFAEGQYTYELRVIPTISDAVKKQLQNARSSDDPSAAAKILNAAGISAEGLAQSGTFSVLRGSVVASDLVESEKTGTRHLTTNARPTTPVTNDQVIPDDLIVQGSACVGLDCVNNESFGFDTIRLKENNTRIKFEDTSASAGFPTTDWQLTANDSASGGANKFSIEDITDNKVPFTVTGNSPTNSIFVDPTGRVGFRTATPVLDLHVSTSNTPAIRLEQTNAGGFTAQTWDVAGNEANFFVRDVTGGSRLPLRIRPGAPTSSLDISADGDIGMGTASPAENLHVFSSDDANNGIQMENTNAAGTSANAFFRAKADVASVSFQSHGSARTIARFGQTLGGKNEMLATAGALILGTLGTSDLILGTNSANRMTINGSTGAITVPGNFTVSGVKNFAVVDPANSKQALYYTALEGPEAGTYYRGTAKTVNGMVVIELPGYFARLTEKDRMTVQITPIGGPGQLFVAEKSPEKITIKVAQGSADAEFDYLVQGVRKGYLNYEVERAGAFPVK